MLYIFIWGNHDYKDYKGSRHQWCNTVKCLAHVSIRSSEKLSLNGILLLYMLQVLQRISSTAQHHRFQLILISTDVASLSHEAGSFLCKLKLLNQERDCWKLWNGQNVGNRSLQVMYNMMLKSFLDYFLSQCVDHSYYMTSKQGYLNDQVAL